MKVGMKMKHMSRLFLRSVSVCLVLIGALFLFSSANAEEVTKTVKIKLFFPRDGTENGHFENGEIVPNWYYFWKEGRVVPALSDFEYKNVTNWYGSYDDETNKLYVCRLAGESQSYSYTVKNKYYRTYISPGSDGIVQTTALEDDVQIIPVGGQGAPNSIAISAGPDNFMHSADDFDRKRILGGDDELNLTNAQSVSLNLNFSGIDCCASTIAHELKHKEIYTTLSGVDMDNDGLPNSYEISSTYHFDPNRPDTYDLGETFGEYSYWLKGDAELLARLAGKNPVNRHTDKDYSK